MTAPVRLSSLMYINITLTQLKHLTLINSDYVTFLPRDAMHSADYAVTLCPSVTHDVRPSLRPSHTMSVCPSVTRRYCVKTAKRIVVLSPSGRHTILVVPHSTLWQYCDGDSLTGASNAGGMKKSRFWTNISLYLEKDTRQGHSY